MEDPIDKTVSRLGLSILNVKSITRHIVKEAAQLLREEHGPSDETASDREGGSAGISAALASSDLAAAILGTFSGAGGGGRGLISTRSSSGRSRQQAQVKERKDLDV